MTKRLVSPLAEISLVVLCVLVAEWAVLPLFGRNYAAGLVPVGAAFAFMLLSHRARGESAREVGWRLDNFLEAARLLLPPMLAVSALLVGWGLYAGTLDLRRWEGGQTIMGVPGLSLVWGPLQQYALQGFINRRAQVVFGRGPASALLTGLLFALFHLPNPWLTLATFAGGLLWAWAYQRAPNLLALGLSHGLLTWALVAAFPPASLNNLRVGFKYFG